MMLATTVTPRELFNRALDLYERGVIIAIVALALAITGSAQAKPIPRTTPAKAAARLALGTFIDTPIIEAINSTSGAHVDRAFLDAVVARMMQGQTVQPGSMTCEGWRGRAVRGRFNAFKCHAILNPYSLDGIPNVPPSWATQQDKPRPYWFSAVLGNGVPYPGGHWSHYIYKTRGFSYTYLAIAG
jgi:hypothetical protein